ncbi:Translation initiation factor IF-2 [Planktothrix tepida]|uniref:Translation initiation factor IF-2 n=2 Tax=Planktothrix TaxID=54304 RepID=A0A1J1LQF6_9CYAN|nr:MULTISPECIES: translation initiation factor IF-2 [Planktothrix]CAD5948281.1 Translation initiation factor IF-2 [Planktothrix pseudagardhii]CAD5962361.1 Translation initiation factor IF-2 [Planktothrix tepida]CUR34816.1 Translation initiation factor IF-2 [Planktothrix tepida PCC 9214]
MNNAKVRIYELSRELNLDNKDILAVCERLNISVKSHSSTISESDKERIEKYVATHPNPGQLDGKSERSHPNGKSSATAPGEKKKQEILEIQKPRIRPNSDVSAVYGSADSPASTSVATPPKSLVSPKAPVKPTLNRPVLSKPNAPAQAGTESSETTASEYSQAEQIGIPAPAEENTSFEEVDLDLSEPPQLSPPPVRPASPVPVSSVPISVVTTETAPIVKNKPVLKTNKPAPKSVEPKSKTDGPERPTPKPQQAPSLASAETKEKDSEARKPPRKEIGTPRPSRSVPELQPPPARKSAVQAIDDDAEPSESAEEEPLIATDDLIKRPKRAAVTLTRPNPPRTGKRGPEWEEEEEEVVDTGKAKSAKVKSKRRAKPSLDEDDDDELNALSLSNANNAMMSISLARPPKPKAGPGQGNVAATTAKPKKQAPSRGGGSSAANMRRTEAKPKAERPEKVIVPGPMTVQELATALALPETEIIKRLFSQGIAVNITETLDYNTILVICQELNVQVETEEQVSGAIKPDNIFNEEDLEHLQRRPPVVTIMGHVDHGKTTLLDAIRETKVAQGEAGGITQHIGAYHVDVEHEGKTQQVVFLDTPGHEAFTAMRARGARVTDVAILVVAADDGVQPQTIEAISHAKAAGVPMIIAINKIDKEGAQPDRVKQELTEFSLVPEEWGGDTIMVPVSAIKGENLDTLLEMILLVAEVEDLYANPNRAAKGTIIEAHLDKSRGPVATLLVQNGTLRVGDIVVAGSVLGKVRAMVDDRGDRVDEASPSFAVEVLGLRDVPAAGDEFDVFENEKEASALATSRAETKRQTRLTKGRISLSEFSARAQEGELKELNLILKADVQGSVEAIVNALKKLPQKEVELQLLLAAPGEITETDIDLAAASDAVLLGFNTTLAHGARQAADRAGVDIRDYNIIYNLLDDVQAAMEGLLEPELVEEALGQVEVRAIFPVGRSTVAGCYVLSGKVIRNCKVRVRRKGEIVHEGALDSLKRMKEDAKEVNAGYECGIALDNFNDWNMGDIIEAYRMTTKRRTLTL